LRARIDWHGHGLVVDFSRGQAIAIPLDPHGPQPAFFTETPAHAEPMRAGSFVGSIAEGGSCNAEVVSFIPHCHGTHTECVGHITARAERVQDTIYTEPTVARLVSLAPSLDGDDAVNNGGPVYADDDLATALAECGDMPFEALVIRSVPVDEDLRSRDYGRETYPVLEPAAIRRLAGSPLRHLLIDTPSLDTAHDGGQLANHHCWWGRSDVSAPGGIDAARRSITEMIFAPADLADGWYWLHLELSPVLGDATASRPVLYPVDGLA